jgi:hypothetical protein
MRLELGMKEEKGGDWCIYNLYDMVHRVNQMMLAVDFDSIEKHSNEADETNENNEI